MQSSEPAFQVTKHSRPYKPGSVMRALIVPLTAVLNHAATQGYCDPPHFLRPRYNDRRVRYGTTDECSRLLAASAPHAAAFWLFAMFIGDRISESLNLQIDDVHQESSWAVFRDTKNGTHRGVALHAQIVELLRVIIGERHAGHVFLTDEGLPHETTPKKDGTEPAIGQGSRISTSTIFVTLSQPTSWSQASMCALQKNRWVMPGRTR